MVAFSYSLTLDAPDMGEDVITLDTQAPNAGDVELRVDLTHTPNRKQILNIIKAFTRRLEGERFGPSDAASI